MIFQNLVNTKTEEKWRHKKGVEESPRSQAPTSASLFGGCSAGRGNITPVSAGTVHNPGENVWGVKDHCPQTAPSNSARKGAGKSYVST